MMYPTFLFRLLATSAFVLSALVPASCVLAASAASAPILAPPGAPVNVAPVNAAATQDTPVQDAGVQSVGDKLKAKYPHLQLLSVTRLGVGTSPLYEFMASGLVGYTDRDVNYVLMGGNLITGNDASHTLVNVTAERAKSSATTLVRSLPIQMAFKEVFGKGERPLIVFSDPDCPFCRKLEKDMQATGDALNATVYVFPYPLTELHPDAEKKVRHIACTTDPSRAWQEWMHNPADWDGFVVAHPAPATCPGMAVVDAARSIGRGLLIDTTPTLLFHNGMGLSRAPSMEELQKGLGYVADHPDDVQSLGSKTGPTERH